MENGWTWSIYIHLPTKVRCSSILCSKLWKKSPEATTKIPAAPTMPQEPRPTRSWGMACASRAAAGAPWSQGHGRPQRRGPGWRERKTWETRGVETTKNQGFYGILMDLFCYFLWDLGGIIGFFSFFGDFIWDDIWSWAPTIFKTQDLNWLN